MCLAIPSKIIEINGYVGIIDADGVKRQCSLMLVEDAKVGDYVIVHAGFALHKIDEADALASLQLLKESAAMLEAQQKADNSRNDH
jgi:hydrogenase expression/formation protein HypC